MISVVAFSIHHDYSHGQFYRCRPSFALGCTILSQRLPTTREYASCTPQQYGELLSTHVKPSQTARQRAL